MLFPKNQIDVLLAHLHVRQLVTDTTATQVQKSVRQFCSVYQIDAVRSDVLLKCNYSALSLRRVSGPREGGEANSLEKNNSYWDCFPVCVYAQADSKTRRNDSSIRANERTQQILIHLC